jgi:RNA polymerase sigma-70 factor (family 1)
MRFNLFVLSTWAGPEGFSPKTKRISTAIRADFVHAKYNNNCLSKKNTRPLNQSENRNCGKNTYFSPMNQSQGKFQDIYNQYHILVYNVALHYLQNLEDAEEITQDVFVKVHQSLDKFDAKSALKTWIYRITINQCLDYLKHKKSKKRFFIFGNKSHNESDYLNAAHFEHPGILLENKEKAAILYGVINELPENQKTAFILSKIDGLTNPEVCEIMQLSLSSVESLLFRAKTALREKLSKKFEEHRKKK